MITVEEAIQIIQKNMPSFGRSKTNLENLSNFTTNEDLIADRDYPPFDRITMDGIAVSWTVYQEGRTEFKVVGVCAAGQPQATLIDATTCLEVMTGAPLPIGCDLVIPYEEVVLKVGFAKTASATRNRFENVHRMSSDFKKGDVVLKKGERLNGPHWGIAASIGKTEIAVHRTPRINVISTGDELVSVSEKPASHQIRRSNSYALKASLQDHGYTDVVLSHLTDDEAAIEQHYRQNSPQFDVMIYSGGVSKGKFDYLPSTLKRLGVEELLHGVLQRPGKPLWFGVDKSRDTVVFGLPGNPVSSLVCLHRYFLRDRPRYARLTEDFTFEKNLTYFLPIKIEYTEEGILNASPLKIKNSGEYSALAGSDGFLELPKDKSHFRTGDAFLFHSWSGQ